MADADVFVETESSNGAGFLALLKDVPLGDMLRWVGGGAAHPDFPAAWSSLTTYSPGAFVDYGGVRFRCLRTNTNFLPTTPPATTVNVFFASFNTDTLANGGAIDDAADSITIPNHQLPNGASIVVDSTNIGLVAGTEYFVVQRTLNTFKLSLTFGGAAVNLTGAPGSNTIRRFALTFDATANVNAGTETITIANHGLANNTPVVLSINTGALVGGVTAGVIVYIMAATTDTFKLTTTPNGTGTPIDLSVAVGTNHIYSPPWVIDSTNRPYEVRIPNARMLTPRSPYSNAASRSITGFTADTVSWSGGVDPDVATGGWCYVRVNSTGQGNLRKLATDTGVGSVQVTKTWSPPIAADGTVFFLKDSSSILSVVRNVEAKTTTITRTGGASVAGMAGRHVIFFGVEKAATFSFATNTFTSVGHKMGTSSRVRLSADTMPDGSNGLIDYFLINVTADTFQLALTAGGPAVVFTTDGVNIIVTVPSDICGKILTASDPAFTIDVLLSDGFDSGGFCVLSGADSCETMADLALSTKCVLQDCTLYMDRNAPVFLTGLDKPTFDATPWQNPRAHWYGGPTVNLTLELLFQLRSRLPNPVGIKVGISASMISPFLQGQLFGPLPAPSGFVGFIGWFHDLRSLDFSPSSPSSLYTATINMITAANALIAAEGNKPRYRMHLIHLLDNDPGDEQRILRLGANTAQLRDSVRAHVGESFPCVISGPSHYGGNDTTREFIYMSMNNIAASDKAGVTGVTDNRNLNEIAGMFAFDNLHFSALGQIELAQNNHLTWDPIFVSFVEDSNAANSMAVEISNIALSYIGETAKVFSLDTTIDQSTQARVCAQFYQEAFKHTREKHTWAFNTFTKSLQVISDKDEIRTDWAFAYVPPPDMDSPIRIKSPGAATTSGEVPSWWRFPNADTALLEDDDPDYEIEIDSKGRRVIYTNVEFAQLKYSARISSKTLVPHSFKIAVARKLAAFISGPIRKDPDFTLKMEALARVETGDAAAIDANRQQKGPPPDRMPWNRA